MDWIWLYRNDRSYLLLPAWRDQGVIAAFTARTGGVSTGPYESLNLGLHVGDRESLVLANRETVAHDLGFALEQMVCCEQVHGSRVAVVKAEDAGRGAKVYRESLPGFDAMVTDCPGIFLTEFYADCIPLYFFDPVRRAVGLAHSGWKGTIGGVAQATVATMQDAFGCRLENISAFIGPGIGPECFAVDQDRLGLVERAFTFSREIIYPNEGNGHVWDLPLTNRMILRQRGLKPENISGCNICTACHQDQFFSYRGARGITGRMAAVIGLQD